MDEIQEHLEASLADKYAIEGPLGEGGMALVYLARDVKHDRQVAVKVLRPELAASLGAERFLREIAVTAKLQHPHILPLYDSGDAEGLLFYVMPFVEGEALSDLIEREKQLSIDEAIRITKEVAGALGHAHAYGLIHRDIKPENIMMSGGHAIVADFGIAKAVSEAGGHEVTSTGTAIGTPAYMSPEQAAGDPGLDSRTDLYALGCMLYEMLIGQPPFTGPNAQAIMARHTMDQVPPPSIMRQSIMPELEDVIFCAMAKTPADRFRTAQEMIDALTAIESGGAPKVRMTRQTSRISQPMIVEPGWKRAVVPVISTVAVVAVAFGAWTAFANRESGPVVIEGGLDPARVAVLYFEDVSPDGALAYLADGITEGLIRQLATVNALDVISRNGVEPFRDPTMARDSIAGVLEAGSLVSGSVEQVGQNLRVTARLIDGTSGADIDRETFQLPATDLLAAQDSVVETVSGFLRTRLGDEVRTRELRAGTRSVDAWGLVQRAERLRKDADAAVTAENESAARAALTRADSLLRVAQTADPRWVQPVVDRGWVAYQRGRQLESGPAEARWLDSALARADEALVVDPDDAQALQLRGTVRYRYWDLRVMTDPRAQQQLLEDSRDDLERAVETDPSLASAFVTLSVMFYDFEDLAQAMRMAERAYEADAYLANADQVIERLFWTSLDRENLPQARRWCDEGARRFTDDPRFLSCQLWVMVTPAVEPDVDSAWALRGRIEEISTNPFLKVRSDLVIGGILARAGLADSAKSVLATGHDRITAELDPSKNLLYVEAFMRTLADEPDVAIDLLKEYTAANPGHDFGEALGTWWWRSLRDHPRFRELTVG